MEQPAQTTENSEPNSPNRPNPIVNYVFKKNKAPVAVPPSLSLETFMEKPSDSSHQKDYHLQSIVHHIGRLASSGHYTAQARRGDDWVGFDDCFTGCTSLEDVVKKAADGPTAYLMLYELGGQQAKPKPPPPTSDISHAAEVSTIPETVAAQVADDTVPVDKRSPSSEETNVRKDAESQSSTELSLMTKDPKPNEMESSPSTTPHNATASGKISREGLRCLAHVATPETTKASSFVEEATESL